jgi:hypothetical protein
MDLTAMSAVLTSIKSAADIAKLIKDSDSFFEMAESKLRLAELMSTLADAKIEVTTIQQLLMDKDSEIRSLQEQLAVRDRLQWEPPYYWLVNKTSKEGPFCQHCFDTDRKLIRLQGNGSGYWDCTACKNDYKDKNYKESDLPGIRPRPFDRFAAY